MPGDDRHADQDAGVEKDFGKDSHARAFAPKACERQKSDGGEDADVSSEQADLSCGGHIRHGRVPDTAATPRREARRSPRGQASAPLLRWTILAWLACVLPAEDLQHCERWGE